MEELIKYVTHMPSASDDSKKAQRYPFMAHEILKQSSPVIFRYFFKEYDNENTLEQSINTETT